MRQETILPGSAREFQFTVLPFAGNGTISAIMKFTKERIRISPLYSVERRKFDGEGKSTVDVRVSDRRASG